MTDFAAIAAILNKTVQEPLADLLNRSNPVLGALNKKAVASQRIYLKARSESSHGAGPIVDGAAVTIPGGVGTSYVAPTLDWSTYASFFSIPKRLIEQTQNQPTEMGNIFMEEVSQATQDLADKVAADIFGGAIADGIQGLQAIMDDANTYAGIDRSLAANANFRAVVVDHENGGGTAGQELSTAVLYALDEAVHAAAGYGFTERPGLYTGVTSRGIMTKYKQLMENIDLSALSAAHFVNQANASGNLGLGSVGWQGIPIIRDRNVVAGAGDQADTNRKYFIDMNQVSLCTLANNTEAANIHQVQGFQSAPDVDGLTPRIEILGNSGEVIEGYVKVYVQLAPKNVRKLGGMIKNILEV